MRTTSRSSTTTRRKPAAVQIGMDAIHPGRFLAEALAELNLTQAQFARAIGVSAMRVSHVVTGSRPVTAELALLIGKAFGQSPQYWLNLQAIHDLAIAKRALGPQLASVRRVASR